jgi:hypothetical protein
MILGRNADLAQIRPVLAALLRRFAEEIWIVFNPWFLVSPDDDEHRPADMASSSADVVCRLSGRELLLRIETDRIGFDWTDLAIESDACSPVSVSDTCYLQCVDASTWYLVSDSAEVLELFERHGFTVFGSGALPFPRLSLKSAR